MKFTAGDGHGTVAFICGGAALLLAAAQPETTGTSRGFIVSTVGLVAIAAGFRALVLVRRGESSTALAPLLGMVGGAIGTVLMALALIAFYFGPATESGSEPAPLVVAEEASVPVAAPSTDADSERMALAQAAGTIAYVLGQVSPHGVYPDALFVDGEGVVSTPDAVSLATVPIGTDVFYSTSPDRTQYAVSLVGPSFDATVTFDSAIGQVHLG